MRKVRTCSGATAVQIAVKEDGERRIVEHLGSARNKTELAALLEVGRQKIAAWQGQGPAGPGVPGTSSGTNRLGLHHGADQVLGPAVGRSARGLHPSGTEERYWR